MCEWQETLADLLVSFISFLWIPISVFIIRILKKICIIFIGYV